MALSTANSRDSRKWAWNVRGLERETFMLNGGIIILSLQSWCFGHVHGTCRIMVYSRPLSTTTSWWPEGHYFGSSEVGEGRSVSLESLGEMNGEMNFASSNRLWLGCCFAFELSGQRIEVVEAVIPNLSSKPPWEGFSWIKFSRGWPIRISNSRMA
jgi:hypothetical protein